jgi:hypothetical protein
MLFLIAAACTGSAATPRALAWRQIDPDREGLGGPSSLVEWQAGYAGVGSGGGEWSGQSWWSTDGTTWTVRDLPTNGMPEAREVVATEAGLVAVGSELVGERSRAVAWTSTDGRTWIRSPDAPDLDPVPGYRSTAMRAIAKGPVGLVAIGSEWGDAGQRVVAWRSEAGREWIRAETDLGGVNPGDVLASGDRFLLAAADWLAGGDEHGTAAMFWYSDDGGTTWTRTGPSLQHAAPMALAARDNVIVAVGYRSTGSLDPLTLGTVPMTWTSADGRSWEPGAEVASDAAWSITPPVPSGLGPRQYAMMSGVVPVPDGFLAVGSHTGLIDVPGAPEVEPTSRTRLELWRSEDGRRWDLVPDALLDAQGSAAGQAPLGIMTLGSNVVIVGGAPGTGATIWFGTE